MEAPRPYRDERDLRAMLQLLRHGRQAANGTYYIHCGDLQWWLYYPPLAGDFWEQIYLWDDPAAPGRLLGWALLSPDWVGFDVNIRPELRGSPQAHAMYIWAEEQALQLARESGKRTIYTLWILHEDEVLRDHFTSRGFRMGRGMLHFTRHLAGDLTTPALRHGFTLRGSKGVVEVEQRARAQYGAFGSAAPFELYRQRFTHFMHSPVYDPQLDIVAVAEDGQVGAFTIVWTDAATATGLFEPVGTHPAFQRHGLGRAVMLEGMRRLKERGMRRAIVNTYEDNLAAIRFYQSVGFQAAGRLGTYEKDVDVK